MIPMITAEDLRELPIFWSRLGFPYDPPRLKEDGQPFVFAGDFERQARYHRDMCRAGIRLHTCILFSGWIGVGRYDYTLTDRVLDAVMGADPSILYMPRIKLNVPIDWCAAYPEEVFAYENAPRDPDAIRALVNTPRHDLLGCESKSGYYAPGYHDDRPNVGGIISMQSLSSEQWMRDAEEALRRLLEHLENGPYADRIFAYQVSFGPCGENMHWGRASDHYGDYGISNLRHFYDFGRKKYGSPEILARKWGQPDLTRETVRLPSPAGRYEGTADTVSLFRGKPEDTIAADYDEFLSDTVVGAIERFGHIVKVRTGKPVGSFYGYYQFCANASYAGHLGLDRLLASPDIDFLAAPMSYHRRRAGEPGGEMCDAMSVNRRKLWIDEIDCRTYLGSTPEAQWICKNIGEVRFCLYRELCKDIAHHSGFWWMDLGDGWYDAPEILAEIRTMTALSADLRKRENRSAADVLLVTDEHAMAKMRISERFHFGFMLEFLQNFHMTGLLIDTCRECDLPELDLTRYRMIVFAYDFSLKKELLDGLKLSPDTALFFNFCTGIRQENDVSLENAEAVTGFSLSEEPGERYPLLHADNMTDGIAEKRVGGRLHVLNTVPSVSPQTLRTLALHAGCTLRAPEGCIVYGTEDYVGVFASQDTDGTFLPPTGTAPGHCDVWEEYPASGKDDCMGTKDGCPVPMRLKKGEFRMFIRRKA